MASYGSTISARELPRSFGSRANRKSAALVPEDPGRPPDTHQTSRFPKDLSMTAPRRHASAMRLLHLLVFISTIDLLVAVIVSGVIVQKYGTLIDTIPLIIAVVAVMTFHLWYWLPTGLGGRRPSRVARELR
jgi:hypothetical protein